MSSKFNLVEISWNDLTFEPINLWNSPMKLSPLIITDVAIKYDGVIYSLPAPNRHHDVIRKIYGINGIGINGPDTQGFLTEFGTFLNRREAFEVALRSGQIKRDISDPKLYQGDELYSEDLW